MVDDSMNEPIEEDLVDVFQSAADQLGGAMAAETDKILQGAVTRFFGRNDWTLGELKGRGVLNQLPSGVEVFCLDGVALVELHPINAEHNQNEKINVLTATRQYRFLFPIQK